MITDNFVHGYKYNNRQGDTCWYITNLPIFILRCFGFQIAKKKKKEKKKWLVDFEAAKRLPVLSRGTDKRNIDDRR